MRIVLIRSGEDSGEDEPDDATAPAPISTRFAINKQGQYKGPSALLLSNINLFGDLGGFDNIIAQLEAPGSNSLAPPM